MLSHTAGRLINHIVPTNYIRVLFSVKEPANPNGTGGITSNVRKRRDGKFQVEFGAARTAVNNLNSD